MALAPDEASVEAARSLTSVNQWPVLGYNDQAIWGHCQGSGKKPYLTRIDLSEPAFKCSCPSRKFPCKHSLALFLLYAERLPKFTQSADCPDWVSEWLDSRHSRKVQKETRVTTAKPVDEKAQVQRQQLRQDKVDQGIADLHRWLLDVVQIGIGELPSKNFSYWQAIAARLVDAQASGLASRIEEMASIAASGRDVMNRLTVALAQLNLLINAYKNCDIKTSDGRCSPGLAADIRHLIGWTTSNEQVLAEPGIADQWLVLAVQRQKQGNLMSQFSWLYGLNSQRSACIIQYAHSTQLANLSVGWRDLTVIDGSLHFYPSATPLRAICGSHQLLTVDDQANQPAVAGLALSSAASTASAISFISMTAACADFQRLRCLNPWLANHLYCVNNIRLGYYDGHWWLQDGDDSQYVLPINEKGFDLWRMMALTGGAVVKAVILTDGEIVSVLAIWHDEYYLLQAQGEIS